MTTAHRTAQASTEPSGTSMRRIAALARGGGLALPAAWIVLIVTFSLLLPTTFANSVTWTSTLATQSVVLILTLGLILPLTTGDIDLSLAYTLTFSSVVVGVLQVKQGWPIGAAVVAALVAGGAIGLVNGLFAVYGRIDPIVTTLGMGTVTYGLTLVVADQTTVSGISPTLVRWTVQERVFGISIQFYYALAVALVLWYVLEHTSLGRRLLIVGRGREVARLSGLRVNRIRIWSLTCAGVMAGLAGVLFAGTSGSADPTAGPTFLLPAFAGAFLGATAIAAGRFNAWGTVIATYFLATGITGLQLLGAENYVQQLFYGGALLTAVLLSQLVTTSSSRSSHHS